MAIALPDLPEHRLTIADLLELRDDAEAFAEASLAPETRRSYASATRAWDAWCKAHDVVALPADPAGLALYVSGLARRLKAGSIAVHIAAITHRQRGRGYPRPLDSPQLARVLAGLRRTLGVAQRRVDALVVDDARAICEQLDAEASLAAKRDAALILVGIAGAFRRSELCALVVADLNFVAGGVEIQIRRSKTDQTGRGATKVIPFGSRLLTCPVRALESWLAAATIVDGPVFRAVDRGRVSSLPLVGGSVARIVQRRVAAAGLAGDYAGHSMRAGFITIADAAGVSETAIIRQTLHATTAQLARYRRPRTLWNDPPAARLGL